MVNITLHNSRFTISALMLCMASVCYGQSVGKKYWALSEIKRIDNKPMHGGTLAYMESIALRYPYFAIEGRLFQLDFPEKKTMSMERFTSLTGERFGHAARTEGLEGLLVDSVTAITETANKLTISFLYRRGLDADKRFEALFEVVGKDEYNEMLKDDLYQQSLQQAAIAQFVDDYKSSAPWRSNNAVTRLKEVALSGRIGRVSLLLPPGYITRTSGNITVEHFGALELGTFADNEAYDIIAPGSGETVATAFLIQGSKPNYNVQEFINRSNLRVLEQSKDGFYAIEPSYDNGEKKVVISRHVNFLYLTQGETSIFLLAEAGSPEVAAQQFGLFKQIRVK